MFNALLKTRHRGICCLPLVLLSLLLPSFMSSFNKFCIQLSHIFYNSILNNEKCGLHFVLTTAQLELNYYSNQKGNPAPHYLSPLNYLS